jgi:hypothetical protein
VWQAKLKGDPTLRWLSQARTTVVHKSDLEASSTAVATLHDNFVRVRGRVKVPALASTPQICEALLSTMPPELAESARDMVISVERTWVASNLPGHELLEALAYAFRLLADLTADAHRQAGTAFVAFDPENCRQSRLGEPCMATTAERRTSRMTVADGRLLLPDRRRIPFDPGAVPALQQRYGELPSVSSNDPFERAEVLLEVAKKTLVVDGFHGRFMHMRTPTGWRLLLLAPRNRAEKFAMIESLANEAHALHVDALVEVMEAWVAPMRAFHEGRNPAEDPERKELLAVSVATAEGSYLVYNTYFSRDAKGKPVLGETLIDRGRMPFYLRPFCRIWGLPPPDASVLHRPPSE